MRRKIVMLLILIFVTTVIVPAPAAGSKIENFAFARYRDIDGNHITIFSDKVVTTVLPVYGFTIKPDGTFEKPGQEREGFEGSTVDLNYVARNFGNSPTTISLSASQIFGDGPSGTPVLRVIGIYLDEGEEGISGQAKTPVNSVDLEIDGSKKLIVRVILEETGDLTDKGFINIVGIDPAGNTDDDNIAQIKVEEKEIVASTKSRLLDTVLPGSSQSFSVSLTNNSEYELDSLVLKDFIGYGGNLVDGVLDSASLFSNYDFSARYFDGLDWLPEPPQNDEEIKGFELTFGPVSPGQSVEISFDVFFPKNVAAGRRYNTASVSYSRLGTTWSSKTNTVDFTIPALGVPLLGPFGYPDAPEMTPEDTTVSTITVFDGDTVIFRHTLKNDGNAPGVMDLLIESANFQLDGWGFVFKDDTGVPLTDTDGSGYVDVGVVAPGQEVDIILEATIPEGVSGSNFEKGFKFIPKTVMGNEENRTIDIIPHIRKSDSLSISKVVLSSSLLMPKAEVRFLISVENESESSTGKITVSDPISSLLSAPYEIEVSKEATVSFNSQERILTVEFDSLDPLESVEITFKCTTVDGLAEGTVIENTATVSGDGTFEDSERVSVKIFHGSLELVKLASPSIVELGSEITYTIEVSNPSTIATVTELRLEDRIPPGTSYVEGSGSIDGEPVEPLILENMLIFDNLKDLKPGEKSKVVYRLRLDEFTGESLKNMVRAIGTILSEEYSTEVVTEPSVVDVRVFRPMNTGTGIIGRIYVDENGNGFYDKDDSKPLPVRLLLQDGSFVVTDKDGLFHFDRLKPGLHTVKVDIDVTPYRLLPNQDSRSLGDDRCFMIETLPGMYTIIDIPLIHRERIVETITYRNPLTLKGFDAASLIVSGNQSLDPSMFSDYGYIVTPLNGQEFVGVDRLMVEVAMPIESRHTLYVNDIVVPESQIGQKANDADGVWLFVKYFNVKLNPGRNRIRLDWQDGTAKGSKEIEVYLSGEPFEFRVSTEPLILTADGVTEVLVVISLVDERGVPSSVGGTLIIEGLDSHIVLEPSDWDGTRLKLENGVSKLKLKPTAQAYAVDFSVRYGDLSKDVRLEYAVESRPPLITGSAQLQYSLKDRSLSFEGGVFGRLNIDRGLLTFRFGEESSADFDTYITHGDESIKGTLAPSSRPYFLRYEIGHFNVQLGDYEFETRGSTGFLSSGTGLSSEYSGDVFSYKLFVNPVYRGKRTEEFRGEGIRGPYYLSEVPASGGETISLITRDSEGEIITRRVLRRGEDYTLYNSNRLLIFSKPVPYFDLDFNPVWIEAVYSVDSTSPGDLDMMAYLTYSSSGWKYTLTGLFRGLSEGYRFASLKAEGSISEGLSPSLELLVSSGTGDLGFRAAGALKFVSKTVVGNLEAHLDRDFKAPGNSRPFSGFGFSLELNPKVFELKLLSGYSFDEKAKTGTLSLELLRDFKAGQVMTEVSLKESLIHKQDGLENEVRLTARPRLSLDKTRLSGEISLGLRGVSPVAGLSLRTDFGIGESLFAGGDVVFDYSGAGRVKLSLTPYILKKLGKVSITAKEKIEFLPDLRFTTIIGFGYTLDTGKIDLEAILSDRVSIGAGYTASYSPGIVNLDFLLQGRHTLVGSNTEDFYALHVGIENREIESLKLRLGTDLRFDTGFALSRFLIESRGEYLGLDRLRPAYHILFTNDLKTQSSRFEVQAGLAYVPQLRSPLALLAEGAYYISRNGEETTSEGRLTLDTVFWYDRTFNFALTGEIYLKKNMVYTINGLRAEKSFADLFYITGAGYLVNDNRGGFYNRFIVQAGLTLWPDTVVYAGYGFGSLKESFLGNLRRDGFYFGVKIKLDDSWFFKSRNTGKLNLYFFLDKDLDTKFDTGEMPTSVKVRIDGEEYESDENGVISVELPVGLYRVELVEYPDSLVSLLKDSPELHVTEYGSRDFYWPFMESPAYVDIRIFVDSNSSGTYDKEEEYLKSFSINIGEDVVFTEDGTLTIPVSPGIIRISLDLASLGSGVSITTGSLNRQLELKPGERKNVEFGVAFQRKIEVVLFRDLNANGLRESDEPLLDASGILTIGGKPFRIGSQTVLEGVPAGVSRASLTMDRGFERLYSRTTSIETIEVDEKGDTRLEIGFAQRSSLNISLIDETGDYLYEVVSLNVDGIEFQVFGMIELVGLVFGEHSIEITDLPKGYTVSENLRTIWLEPGKNSDLTISVEKK
ncbi:DUF11 domain-containing protein [Mesotoga sp. B105.6.4]|uniref:DUF11 domain-containing protein n=1 Tax=Mesotoga sp. B105.6.4 TaxID=1582224 RepID=UPI000CCC447F|nr:DUF11 domain-containing protein [Mesotoga sp. B105.6.4]PNS34728.1 hypothetical protein RJ60_14500 [Mesotoga sp. B105.6.4]